MTSATRPLGPALVTCQEPYNHPSQGSSHHLARGLVPLLVLWGVHGSRAIRQARVAPGHAGPRVHLRSSPGLRTPNRTCQSPLLPGPGRGEAPALSPGVPRSAWTFTRPGSASRPAPGARVGLAQEAARALQSSRPPAPRPRDRTQSGPGGARLTCSTGRRGPSRTIGPRSGARVTAQASRCRPAPPPPPPFPAARRRLVPAVRLLHSPGPGAARASPRRAPTPPARACGDCAAPCSPAARARPAATAHSGLENPTGVAPPLRAPSLARPAAA